MVTGDRPRTRPSTSTRAPPGFDSTRTLAGPCRQANRKSARRRGPCRCEAPSPAWTARANLQRVQALGDPDRRRRHADRLTIDEKLRAGGLRRHGQSARVCFGWPRHHAPADRDDLCEPDEHEGRDCGLPPSPRGGVVTPGRRLLAGLSNRAPGRRSLGRPSGLAFDDGWFRSAQTRLRRATADVPGASGSRFRRELMRFRRCSLTCEARLEASGVPPSRGARWGRKRPDGIGKEAVERSRVTPRNPRRSPSPVRPCWGAYFLFASPIKTEWAIAAARSHTARSADPRDKHLV